MTCYRVSRSAAFAWDVIFWNPATSGRGFTVQRHTTKRGAAAHARRLNAKGGAA